MTYRFTTNWYNDISNSPVLFTAAGEQHRNDCNGNADGAKVGKHGENEIADIQPYLICRTTSARIPGQFVSFPVEGEAERRKPERADDTEKRSSHPARRRSRLTHARRAAVSAMGSILNNHLTICLHRHKLQIPNFWPLRMARRQRKATLMVVGKRLQDLKPRAQDPDELTSA